MRLCPFSALFTKLDSKRNKFGSRWWAFFFWAVRFSTLTHYRNSFIPRCSSTQIWQFLLCSNQMHSIWQLYIQNLTRLIHLSETGMSPRLLTDAFTGLVEIAVRGKRQHINHNCPKMAFILNAVSKGWLSSHIDHTWSHKFMKSPQVHWWWNIFVIPWNFRNFSSCRKLISSLFW